MSTNEIIGRDLYKRKIGKLAESDYVDNQAFLGLKGVGKTRLFKDYFNKERLKNLALIYKKLFVFAQLDSKKKGVDLDQFLCDKVMEGVLMIPDLDKREQIRAEIEEIRDQIQLDDTRLSNYLEIIRDHNYKLILIMDHFHTLAIDTDIGREQYDKLRSLNESQLVNYWIITDTDLEEARSTEEYRTSFFSQKFTKKTTIPSLRKADTLGLIGYMLGQNDDFFSDEEIAALAELSDGIPELARMLVDIGNNLRRTGKEINIENLTKSALNNGGVRSLFKSWSDGLSPKQKEMIYWFAEQGKGLTEEDIIFPAEQLPELGDQVGRGLLHLDNNELRWSLSVDLFRQYVQKMGPAFYQGKAEAAVVPEMNMENVRSVPEHISTTYVQNIYVRDGDFVQGNKTETNILTVNNIVTGMEHLYETIYDENRLPDDKELIGLVNNDFWNDPKENDLDEFASGIIESEKFSKDELTPEEMDAFSLNEELLDSLSSVCRNQLVCGVRIYDLIQKCIDNYGMDVSKGESARGILFVKAFEQHLKDIYAPFALKVPKLAELEMYPSNKPFNKLPVDKTTVGNYRQILENSAEEMANVCGQITGQESHDLNWWNGMLTMFNDIVPLRNGCCHSTNDPFGTQELQNLKTRLFDQQLFDKVLVLKQLPPDDMYQTKTPETTTYEEPDESLIGKVVLFKVLSKGSNGNFKGTIDDRFEGSLPKSQADGYVYGSVVNTEIRVRVERIQDGKFILLKI